MLLPSVRNGAIRSQARQGRHKPSLTPRNPPSSYNRALRFNLLGYKNTRYQSSKNGHISIDQQEDHSSLQSEYGGQNEIKAQESNEAQNGKSKMDTLLRLTEFEKNGSLAPIESLHSLGEKDPSNPDDSNSMEAVVSEALQQEDPQALLLMLPRASQDPDYLRSLPPSTFSEIIRMLDPKRLLEPYKRAYRRVSYYRIRNAKNGVPQLEELLLNYTRLIEDLLYSWRDSGRSLGMIDYKAILNVARTVGNGEMAEHVFKIIRQEGLEMDTECYNYYFEAKCWSNAYHPVERNKLRVTPSHYSARLPRKPGQQAPVGFRGHKTGDKGLEFEIINGFSEMVKQGIVPDVDSFRHIMTAMGRLGDIRNVKSVLHKVWNVDVDTIYDPTDGSPVPSQPLSRTSPLYPTKDLLFTIAHIFGSNNDIPLALRIVDIFSRRYEIEISNEVWEQLFEWTYVLSTRRYGREKTPGNLQGQLPLKSVENLWTTMVSEPYNTTPTMPMWNYRIKSFFRRGNLEDMIQSMRSALKLHGKDLTVYRKLFQVQTDPSGQQNQNQLTSTDLHRFGLETPSADSLSLSLAVRQQQIDVGLMNIWRNFAMVQDWLRLLFRGDTWAPSYRERINWDRIGLPDIVGEFWAYRPWIGFHYETESGKVEKMRAAKSNLRVWVCSSVCGGIRVAVAEDDDGVVAVDGLYYRLTWSSAGLGNKM